MVFVSSSWKHHLICIGRGRGGGELGRGGVWGEQSFTGVFISVMVTVMLILLTVNSLISKMLLQK